MAAIRGMSLKNVVKIRGSFCSFDPKTTTIRDFLRRVNAKNMTETNNKCDIKIDVKNDNSEPSIEVTYGESS
ncbi:hypothetical protein QZH41_014277 [Actinostola sp. cb2023]|nr:hypothetical protein QZH41_014277 [Actinostola sp. cb2023]